MKVTFDDTEHDLEKNEDLINEVQEFVLPLAEENFIRGYNQALFDVDESNRAMQELEKQANDQD